MRSWPTSEAYAAGGGRVRPDLHHPEVRERALGTRDRTCRRGSPRRTGETSPTCSLCWSGTRCSPAPGTPVSPRSAPRGDRRVRRPLGHPGGRPEPAHARRRGEQRSRASTGGGAASTPAPCTKPRSPSPSSTTTCSPTGSPWWPERSAGVGGHGGRGAPQHSRSTASATTCCATSPRGPRADTTPAPASSSPRTTLAPAGPQHGPRSPPAAPAGHPGDPPGQDATAAGRADGPTGASSAFTRAHETSYTSPALLDAEARLLAAADDRTAPTAPPPVTASPRAPPAPRHARHPRHARPACWRGRQRRLVPRLWGKQARQEPAGLVGAAARRPGPRRGHRRGIRPPRRRAGSGRPAPARPGPCAPSAPPGNTHTTGLSRRPRPVGRRSARTGRRRRHPPCETTAKRQHETAQQAAARVAARGQPTGGNHEAGGGKGSDQWRLWPGQLVIVDEASLAATLTLDQLATQASAAGAKVLLVGDHHQQLGAINAGGAFGLLARATHAAELTLLCDSATGGRPTPADGCDTATQPPSTSTPRTAGSATAPRKPCSKRPPGLATRPRGRATSRAHRHRQPHRHRPEPARPTRPHRPRHRPAEGTEHVLLPDDGRINVGDQVVTRHNERRLRAGGGWVRNGDLWHVQRGHPDGSLTVTRAPSTQHPGNRTGGCRIGPAPRRVRGRARRALGYAVTVHRAQGLTAD